MKHDTVIVTYNNLATIARCLASLPLGNSPIVIDNASPDATAEIVDASKVTLRRLPQNVGFAAAANLGAGLGQAPYIFFLNPDAYLVKPTIQPAVDFLETHPDIAALGFQLLDEKKQPEVSFGPPVSLRSLFTNRRRSPDIPSRPIPVGWVSGGAFLIRRKAFTEIGGFDSQFFLYWEDIDLGRRLRRGGERLVYFPAVQIIHERGTSLKSISQKTRLYDDSADKYFRKHYSRVIWLTQRYLRFLYRLLSRRVR